MAWNGSDNHGRARTPAAPQKKAPGVARGLVAGAAAVVLVSLVLFLVIGRARTPAAPQPNRRPARDAAGEVKPAAPAPEARATTPAEKVQRIKQELNDQVKEFVKKSPGTNKVSWIVPPLAPDDPDRALQTRVTQELGSLLSIEPGEPMPPFPYSFLLEDDRRARGEEAGRDDTGDKLFLESLKKFKILAKETDDENRLAYKAKLVEAQGELLAGIDQGISVDDSIRAAYEFRKRAYEMRATIVKTLSDLHEKDGDDAGTLRQITDMNNRLAEEGIKKINVGEVIRDYEEQEEDE